MNACVAWDCRTASPTVLGLVRSACTRVKPPVCSSVEERPGIGFWVSRMASVTFAPRAEAVRAAADPTAPVGPKTMTLWEAIFKIRLGEMSV